MKKAVLQFAVLGLIGLSTLAMAQHGEPKKEAATHGKVKVVIIDAEGKPKTFEEKFEGEMSVELKQKIKEFTKNKHVQTVDVLKSSDSGEELSFAELANKEHKINLLQAEDAEVIVIRKKKGKASEEVHNVYFIHEEDQKLIELQNENGEKKLIKVETIVEREAELLEEQVVEEEVHDFVEEGGTKKRTVTI